MRQAIILLIMTFLFASGCGPADPSHSQNKPTKKNISVVMDDTRLVEIESALAQIEQLNETVIKQDKTIRRLSQQVEHLTNRLASADFIAPPRHHPIRIVFYDFDQTLPVIHIFHETKGADDVSEKSDQFFVDAFGGGERIERLKKHFERLVEAEVKCSIISYGHTAVIKESLARVGLGDFFAKDAIIGRDSEALKRFKGQKHKVISEEMGSRSISYEEAIFVDDSKKNIDECEADGTCRILHVHERRGLTEKDLVFLETELIKK